MTTDRKQEWRMVPAPASLPSLLAEGHLFPRRPSTDGTIADNLEDAADDLMEWMAAYPQDLERYRQAGAWMSYRVALHMATAHFTEPALHYFAIAADLNPSAPDMRINYAVALHSLGREEEAIEQYEAALPLLDPEADAHVFLLAATLLARNGHQERARQVLSSLADCPPQDEAFWDLWAELEPPEPLLIGIQKAEPTPLSTGRANHVSSGEGDTGTRICRACGGSVPLKASFCRYCGAPLESPTAYCPECGYKIKAGTKFCSHCGGSLLPS